MTTTLDLTKAGLDRKKWKCMVSMLRTMFQGRTLENCVKLELNEIDDGNVTAKDAFMIGMIIALDVDEVT